MYWKIPVQCTAEIFDQDGSTNVSFALSSTIVAVMDEYSSQKMNSIDDGMKNIAEFGRCKYPKEHDSIDGPGDIHLLEKRDFFGNLFLFFTTRGY